MLTVPSLIPLHLRTCQAVALDASWKSSNSLALDDAISTTKPILTRGPSVYQGAEEKVIAEVCVNGRTFRVCDTPFGQRERLTVRGIMLLIIWFSFGIGEAQSWPSNAVRALVLSYSRIGEAQQCSFVCSLPLVYSRADSAEVRFFCTTQLRCTLYRRVAGGGCVKLPRHVPRLA